MYKARNSFSILFLILFLLQCSIKTIIVSAFYVFQNEIAQTLCENRNKPEMHCKGKCFLKKQLKKQENNEQNKSTLLKNIKDAFINSEVATNVLYYRLRVTKNSYFDYTIKPYTVFQDKVYHPPMNS